jgi:flagellar basal-body rod protein FlgF
MQSIFQTIAEANRQIDSAQSLVSNNLANTGTTAFKADLYAAQVTYRGDFNVDASALPNARESVVDLSSGNVTFTGRDLDIAINGSGWMQVLTPGGEEVLSRRGDLRVDLDGRLVDGVGRQVMSETGPVAIQPDATSIAIGSDGTISFAPPGNAGAARIALGRIMLVDPNPADLTKSLDGEIRIAAGAGPVPAAGIQVVAGALESSNVNPISAMVEMISLSRAFEAQSKTLKSADEMNESSASLMRVQAG